MLSTFTYSWSYTKHTYADTQKRTHARTASEIEHPTVQWAARACVFYKMRPNVMHSWANSDLFIVFCSLCHMTAKCVRLLIDRKCVSTIYVYGEHVCATNSAPFRRALIECVLSRLLLWQNHINAEDRLSSVARATRLFFFSCCWLALLQSRYWLYPVTRCNQKIKSAEK